MQIVLRSRKRQLICINSNSDGALMNPACPRFKFVQLMAVCVCTYYV